jgi:uncharacterized protein with GYD domain
MATYIALFNFTDEGIRTVKDTTRRADAVTELAGKFGCKVKDIYWTLGAYDVVSVIEASDDASLTAFGLAVGSKGAVRSQTLRAFNKAEMNQILAKLG